MDITFGHSLSIEQYNGLRRSVNFTEIAPRLASISLQNSLYLCVALVNDEPIGMTRLVGDGGYSFFICDVVVHPNYQSQGIGRMLITNTLDYIESLVNEDETVMINLMSAYDKEKFYQRLGFHKRPFGNHGCGMSLWISK